MKINIAIIGLGRIGSILLQQILRYQDMGVNIVAVAEIAETPGKILARKNKLNIIKTEEIVAMGEKVDIIFELTDNIEFRQQLRNMLKESKNYNTVIAVETIAVLICLMLTNKSMPNVHKHTGY